MKKVLVTGGSGFLGSYLISELIKNDKEVIVLDNGFRQGFSNLSSFNNNVTLVKGDVTKREDWNLLPKDIDFVFHLAAINGTKYFYEIPEKVINVNILGTMNFVDWLQNTSVKRFFFASSSEVYGKPRIFPTPETESLQIPDPNNPRYSYSSSKIMGETITINFAKSYGIDFSIARIHNAYGPQMGSEHVIPEFIRKCVKEESFTVQGDGETSRSFCYVTDIINAIILISTHQKGRNEIFNIGNPTETSINELIKLLEKIHGKQIKPIYEPFLKAGTNRRVPDLKKISKLGYKPKVNLEKGLKETYDWYEKIYKGNT
jgi:nucleoside-diphosphate-sugar epimerase